MTTVDITVVDMVRAPAFFAVTGAKPRPDASPSSHSSMASVMLIGFIFSDSAMILRSFLLGDHAPGASVLPRFSQASTSTGLSPEAERKRRTARFLSSAMYQSQYSCSSSTLPLAMASSARAVASALASTYSSAFLPAIAPCRCAVA